MWHGSNPSATRSPRHVSHNPHAVLSVRRGGGGQVTALMPERQSGLALATPRSFLRDYKWGRWVSQFRTESRFTSVNHGIWLF